MGQSDQSFTAQLEAKAAWVEAAFERQFQTAMTSEMHLSLLADSADRIGDQCFNQGMPIRATGLAALYMELDRLRAALGFSYDQVLAGADAQIAQLRADGFAPKAAS